MELDLGFRKVNAIGESLIISLPKVWTRNNQIQKGDKVSVRLEPDNSLRITVAVRSPGADPADPGRRSSERGQPGTHLGFL